MTTNTMQAVRIHAYGGPEVLRYEAVPVPTPQADDVLIRVHAAAVNPFDWHVRAGYFQTWFQHTLPLTLGWDVSGVIEATGADVHNVQVGESVYARPDSNRDGSYAEYVVVRASEVVPKPQSLDHLHAAAVPQAALVAWKCLFDAANLAARQTVLIHGAAGGVGTFAVQLAKWRGAHVIATASGPNLAFLRDLGADEVIDYTATRFEDVVRDVDVVLDSVGQAEDTQQRSWALLKPGGMLVSIVVPPDAAEAAAHQVQSRFIALQPDAQQLAEITRLIDAGQLRPIVSTVLPLHEARQAHALIETRHTRGKIVLQVGE